MNLDNTYRKKISLFKPYLINMINTKFLILALCFCGLFFVTQVSIATSAKPIYSMFVSGNITLNKATSYARIILTDTKGNKYLVYEASGPFDSGSFSFTTACEETCVLNGVIPKSVDTELSDATLTISQLATLDNEQGLNQQVKSKGIKPYASELDKNQEQVKINKINEYIKKNNLKWTAGETSISKLSFSEKKKLLGSPKNMPNLQGLEYYKGGIFEMNSDNKAKSATGGSSVLPTSFDWRNRHGKNWLTSVKHQGSCGSCWAHATVGTIEGVANIYFNQQLNLNLSEQDLISCSGAGRCEGGSTKNSLDYCLSSGITIENCFPYKEIESFCEEKCNNWKNKIIKCVDWEVVSDLTTENIKRLLIESGPLLVDYPYWGNTGHSMVLVGYEMATSQETIWIFKNSWGYDHGDKGYFKTTGSPNSWDINLISAPIKINYMSNLEIKCEDEDEDNFCNWGISKTKPDTCPSSCKKEKDWDDSDPNIGSSPPNTSLIPTDIIPPSVGEVSPIVFRAGQKNVFSVSVSDNKKVGGCKLIFDRSFNMNLSSDPCSNCTASVEIPDGMVSFLVKARPARVECWDISGNLGIGPSVLVEIIITNINIDEEPPSIGFMRPTEAITGKKTRIFSDNISDNERVYGCDFYLDGLKQGMMTLSEIPCQNCYAYIDYTFNQERVYSAYTECWDGTLNTTVGLETNINVRSGPLYGLSVGKIQPTTASLNVSEFFSARVSDEKGIRACGFKVNGVFTEYMTLSENPCKDCDARINYTFTSKGNYSVQARCTNNDGKSIDGDPITISIGNKCPDCAATRTDFCENPPKCEKNCGADQQCDEKENASGWISGSGSNSVCNSCSVACKYSSSPNNKKPLNYQLIQNTCYSACDISCTSNGWFRVFASAYCKTEQCGTTKVSANICYYNPNCGVNGCNYSGADSNKKCDSSVCSISGWDNSKCSSPTPSPSPTPVGTWTPCNPINGWKCDKIGNSNSCEGKHIAWGDGNDGEIVCPIGTIVTDSKCEGRNDDFVQLKEIKVNIIPDSKTLSNSVSFRAYSSSYCKFGCNKLFCGSDGCAWAKCEPGTINNIDKIEFKVYNSFGFAIYSRTINRANNFSWNGIDDKGKKLNSGTYGYKAIVYLTNGKSYTSQDMIKIQ